MWYERCVNPHGFERMYDSPEGLDRVELYEVVLRPDGRYLQLRVELPRFPERPPPRWDALANAVQVAVDFWSVEELSVEGWSHLAVGRLSLVPEGDALRLSFEAGTVRITARCATARIQRFIAYTAEPLDDGA